MAECMKDIISTDPSAWSSAEMKEAAVKWNAIEKLLAGKKDKMLLVQQTMEFLAMASDAYSSFVAQYLEDRDRIVCSYSSSVRCMTHYGNITDILRKEDVMKFQHGPEVNATIDKIAGWLESHGWFGLPKPVYPDGAVKIKTAAMIVSDMGKFAKARYNLMAMEEEQNSR